MSLLVWSMESAAEPPPVSAPIVREGDFALELARALKAGEPETDVEAESMLGTAGVAPRNGWIADYPVTPDIIGELRDSIIYAAQARTIPMDRDTALKVFEGVQSMMYLSVTPAVAGPPASARGTVSDTGTAEVAYPDEETQAEYYSDEGPPVVTYYAPPPAYSYLYAWVPYPFWWTDVWFGGFFVLRDFHRDHWRDGRHSIVSNHFNDVSAHRVFRVDPVNRHNGRTFAGVGAPKANNFIGTGVQRSPERIFNNRRPSGQGLVAPQKSATVREPASRGYRSTNPFPQDRVYSQPAGAGRTYAPRSAAPSGGGGRAVTAPSGGGRSASPPGGGSRGHEGGGRR